jgi:hypothetical protein
MESGRARRWKGRVPGGWPVVATGVAVVLSFGACGGGSERSSPEPAAVKTQAPSTTTTVVPVTDTAPPRTKTLPSTTTTTLQGTGSAPPPSAECTTVGFTPNSDDAASSIVATGLSCDEAEALVRKIGPSVGPFGPARIELDGFECVLTRTDDVELAHGFFECTSGSKRITFVRS